VSKGRWIPISALNHDAYCPRRCALIHQEQVFEENRFTLEGQELHERVDQPSSQAGVMKVETSVRLWSHQRHLMGIADEIEWHDDVPYPVEFKRSKRHSWVNDDIQLCAQALCIEEMLGVSVAVGPFIMAPAGDVGKSLLLKNCGSRRCERLKRSEAC